MPKLRDSIAQHNAFGPVHSNVGQRLHLLRNQTRRGSTHLRYSHYGHFSFDTVKAYIHSGYNRAEERTRGSERQGDVDSKHIYGSPVELLFRQDQLPQVRARPGGMERNVARADCTPVCLKADCLPDRASTELRRQPDDAQPVAGNKTLDVSSALVMVANTTLQRKLNSESGQDHAQVMRRWMVAETVVEAVDERVDVVLAEADDEE